MRGIWLLRPARRAALNHVRMRAGDNRRFIAASHMEDPPLPSWRSASPCRAFDTGPLHEGALGNGAGRPITDNAVGILCRRNHGSTSDRAPRWHIGMRRD